MKEGPLVQMLDRQRVQQAAADEAKKLVDAAALAAERLVDATKEASKLRKQQQRPRRQLHCHRPKKHRSSEWFDRHCGLPWLICARVSDCVC
jgi:hypothetical protein